MVGIIDYGVGNLFSLKSSFKAIGAEAFVSSDAEELAKKIGVNQSMISHYITGRSMPALDTFSRICTVLDLDANDILCVERPDY